MVFSFLFFFFWTVNISVYLDGFKEDLEGVKVHYSSQGTGKFFVQTKSSGSDPPGEPAEVQLPGSHPQILILQ